MIRRIEITVVKALSKELFLYGNKICGGDLADIAEIRSGRQCRVGSKFCF